MVWLYIECYKLDELESLKKQDCPHFRYQLQVQGPPALQTSWLQIGGSPHTHCQIQCFAERLAKLTEGSYNSRLGLLQTKDAYEPQVKAGIPKVEAGISGKDGH